MRLELAGRSGTRCPWEGSEYACYSLSGASLCAPHVQVGTLRAGSAAAAAKACTSGNGTSHGAHRRGQAGLHRYPSGALRASRAPCSLRAHPWASHHAAHTPGWQWVERASSCPRTVGGIMKPIARNGAMARGEAKQYAHGASHTVARSRASTRAWDHIPTRIRSRAAQGKDKGSLPHRCSPLRHLRRLEYDDAPSTVARRRVVARLVELHGADQVLCQRNTDATRHIFGIARASSGLRGGGRIAHRRQAPPVSPGRRRPAERPSVHGPWLWVLRHPLQSPASVLQQQAECSEARAPSRRCCRARAWRAASGRRPRAERGVCTARSGQAMSAPNLSRPAHCCTTTQSCSSASFSHPAGMHQQHLPP